MSIDCSFTFRLEKPSTQLRRREGKAGTQVLSLPAMGSTIRDFKPESFRTFSATTKQAAEKERTASEFPEKQPSAAKAGIDSFALLYGLRPVPLAERVFPQAVKVVPCYKAQSVKDAPGTDATGGVSGRDPCGVLAMGQAEMAAD